MTWTKAGRIAPPPIALVNRDDVHVAPGCPCGGSGWQAVQVDGVERLRRCGCWGERRNTQALAAAGVPARYSHARLGDYQARGEKQTLALAHAKRFLKAFPACRGLWLSGTPGAGKTHLAAAVLRSVIAGKSVSGVFTGAGELLHAIRRTYQGEGEATELSVYRRVTEADVLVLDDLGADKPSDWAQATIGLVINTRYNAQRPTIVTTTLLDLVDTTDPRSVTFNLGLRTRSRLCEMCLWIEM